MRRLGGWRLIVGAVILALWAWVPSSSATTSADENPLNRLVGSPSTSAAKGAAGDEIPFIIYVVLGAGAIAALIVIIYRRDKSPRAAAGHSLPGYERADYGIPHAKFRKGADGFAVSFNKIPLSAHKMIYFISSGLRANVILYILPSLVIFPFLLLTLLWCFFFGRISIGVAGDTVFINGKKFVRAHFGAFYFYKMWQSPHQETARVVLGYTYGNRGFAIGGAWEHRKAQEFASALNAQLRRAPVVADASRTTPETLRNTRPTEF